MNGLRPALAAGLLYSLPLGLWLIDRTVPGPLPPDLSGALPALVLSQALILLLLAPAALNLTGTAAPLAAAALIIAVPWPLLTLALASGSLSLADLARTEGAVALWALAIGLALGLAGRLPAPADRIAPPVVQAGALLVLLWALAAGLVPGVSGAH